MTTPTDRARFADLLAAEWIKIRSLRSLYGLFAIGLVIAVASAWFEGSHVRVAPGAASFFNPLIYPFNDLTWTFLAVLAASFGALTVAGEYFNGLIRTTFTAVPSRRRVIGARALILAATMALFGLVDAVVSVPIAGVAVSGQLTGLSLTNPSVLRAVLASTLLLTVAALIGMSIGALIRHPAAAVTTAWAALLFLPEILGSGTVNLPALAEGAPLSVWTAIADTQAYSQHPAPLPSTPIAWILYTAWPLAAFAVTVVVVERRDA
jgi:ABC-type transport system involved in multi-copper enzyme maturation permease subunit